MPFLPPNQQHQSTEGITNLTKLNRNVKQYHIHYIKHCSHIQNNTIIHQTAAFRIFTFKFLFSFFHVNLLWIINAGTYECWQAKTLKKTQWSKWSRIWCNASWNGQHIVFDKMILKADHVTDVNKDIIQWPFSMLNWVSQFPLKSCTSTSSRREPLGISGTGFFTNQMSFLSPNQQWQSTAGNTQH